MKGVNDFGVDCRCEMINIIGQCFTFIVQLPCLLRLVYTQLIRSVDYEFAKLSINLFDADIQACYVTLVHFLSTSHFSAARTPHPVPYLVGDTEIPTRRR